MKVNKTYLSLDNAETRGFIHRDYIAHCLRWTHVIKHLHIGNLYQRARILDIGCGKEMPLAKMIYSSKMSPDPEAGGLYVGLDATKFEVPEMLKGKKIPIKIYPETNIADLSDDQRFDVITCFEVLEHMEPQNVVLALKKMRELVSNDGCIFTSTPNYDPKVGAAGNHPNEMNVRLLKYLFKRHGLHIHMMYGTFASIRDYEKQLTEAQREIFVKLREYYDTNYLSTLFAPLFPEKSRNILYVLQKTEEDTSQEFQVYEDMTNNPTWVQVLKEDVA